MKNILVVEDELEIRQLLANYLRNEGCSVSEAEDDRKTFFRLFDY